MNRIHSKLHPRARSGAWIAPLSLALLAGSLFCGAQTPAPTQPAVPGKSKPLPQWSPADWKAYGTSIGNDPAVQKLSPLDRAKYVADKVGQQYDAAGVSPNNWYFGKGRQGLGGEAPGTCGDLTVNMEAALEGAGFQTGNVEVEQSGVGYYNPFNVNRNHGAPIVRVDGKEYVFDMWYHSGSEGKFSGFKDSAFAMPLDDWKSLMTDEGYKVSTYAPPPPPPTSKKNDAETPEKEAEPPPEPAGKTSSDESTGQTPESAPSTPDAGSQADALPGETETDDTAAEGSDEDSSEDGDEAAGETDDTAAGNNDSDEEATGDSDEEATGDSEDETTKPDDADTEDGEPEDEDAADKPETGEADDSADDDGKSDADGSGDDESGADESGEDASEGTSDAESPGSDADSNSGGAPGDTTVGYVENSEGRITVTETRGADGSLIRITETETDSSGNVKGTTTYEGGTGEGKYTPGGDLKDAEPPPDGEVSPETASGGVSTAGDFAQNWSQSQNQRGADGSLTMANNSQMNEAANVGNQTLADANSVRDSGGRDSQATRDAATRATSKSDRENSWGKAIGDALESGVTEGGKAFGAALGGAAADKAVGEIFGTDSSDSDEDEAVDGSSAAAPGNAPSSGSTKGNGKSKGDRDDDAEEDDDNDSSSDSSSGSSGDSDSDGSSSSSGSDDPLGVTGTTKNDDGTVTIRYGCGYSWSGTPPGPSRCPICSRETVSTETSPASGSDEPPPEDPTDSDDEPVYEPPFEPEEPSMDPPEDDGPITYEGWSS